LQVRYALRQHYPIFSLKGRARRAEVIFLTAQLTVSLSTIVRHRQAEFLRATDFQFLDFQGNLVNGLGGIEREQQRLLTRLFCHPTASPRPSPVIKDIVDGMSRILRSHLHSGRGRNVYFPGLGNRVVWGSFKDVLA
jgi:hypothetical protein